MIFLTIFDNRLFDEKKAGLIMYANKHFTYFYDFLVDGLLGNSYIIYVNKKQWFEWKEINYYEEHCWTLL